MELLIKIKTMSLAQAYETREKAGREILKWLAIKALAKKRIRELQEDAPNEVPRP